MFFVFYNDDSHKKHSPLLLVVCFLSEITGDHVLSLEHGLHADTPNPDYITSLTPSLFPLPAPTHGRQTRDHEPTADPPRRRPRFRETNIPQVYSPLFPHAIKQNKKANQTSSNWHPPRKLGDRGIPRRPLPQSALENSLLHR